MPSDPPRASRLAIASLLAARSRHSLLFLLTHNKLTAIGATRMWHLLCESIVRGGRGWPPRERTRVMQDTKVKDAVDQVRVAAQDLHKAITDAAAKTGGAAKA